MSDTKTRLSDAYRRPALYEDIVHKGRSEGQLSDNPTWEEVQTYARALNAKDGSSIPYPWIGDDLSDSDLDDLWNVFAGDSRKGTYMSSWWADKKHQIAYRLVLRLTRAESEREHLKRVLACERGEWAPEGWSWEVDDNFHGIWINRTLRDAQGWPLTVRRLVTSGWSHDGGKTRSNTAIEAIQLATEGAKP